MNFSLREIITIQLCIICSILIVSCFNKNLIEKTENLINGYEFEDFGQLYTNIDSMVCTKGKVELILGTNHYQLSNFCHKSFITRPTLLINISDTSFAQNRLWLIENYLMNPQKLANFPDTPDWTSFQLNFPHSLKPREMEKSILLLIATYNALCKKHGIIPNFRLFVGLEESTQ